MIKSGCSRSGYACDDSFALQPQFWSFSDIVIKQW